MIGGCFFRPPLKLPMFCIAVVASKDNIPYVIPFNANGLFQLRMLLNDPKLGPG